MNIEEYEKSKNELENLKNQIEEQIKINKKKIKILESNTLENKIQVTLFISILAYFLLILLSLGFSSTLITNIFPGFTYPIFLISSSICIGAIGKNLLFKKNKIKDRLKSISNAKNEAEKIEESVLCQIEINRLNNKSIVLDEAIKTLNSEQEIINTISSKYNINVNDKTIPNSCEVKNNINELTTTTKKQYEELDKLSTNKILNKKFFIIKEKINRRMEMIIFSMISGISTMATMLPPIFIIRDSIQSTSTLVTLATPIIPLLTGVISSNLYMLKRNSTYKKAFNNLKEKLNISEEEDKNIEELEKLISNKLNDIILSEIQIQENMRYLDRIDNETKKNISNYIDDNYIEEFKEELNKEDKGPTLVKRMTISKGAVEKLSN